MKYCPKCGAELIGSFCTECGCDTEQYRAEHEAEKKRKADENRKRIVQRTPKWVCAALSWCHSICTPVWNFIRKYPKRLTAAAVASVLLITTTIILIVNLTNIFCPSRVDNIELGFTKEQVQDELGEPYTKSDYEWIYYSNSYIKIQKKIEKLKAKQEQSADNFFNSDVDEFEDIENAIDNELASDAEIEKLKEKLKVTKHDIIIVRFDNLSHVREVSLELDYCKSKTDSAIRVVKKIAFTPESIGKYTNPARTEYGAKVYYESGEYRMDYISFQNISEINTQSEGSALVAWRNAWGECSATIPISDILRSGDIIDGTLGENISYTLTVLQDGTASKMPPLNLTLSGSGTLNGAAAQIVLSKFAGAVTEITFKDGISKITGNPFRDCTSLQTITLNTTLKNTECTAFLNEKKSTIQFIGDVDTLLRHGSDEHTSYHITAPAKCKEGYTTYTCTACKTSYQTDFTQGLHSKDSSVEGIIIAPTCIDRGYTTYQCADCHKTYRADFVAENGIHAYLPENTTAPTCTEQGYTSYCCSVCEHRKQDKYVVATGHTPTDEGIVTPPSCEYGYTTHHCAVCDTDYQDAFVAAVHSFETNHVCTACGYCLYTRIDADGNKSATGEYILFGSYPQTKVTDSTLNQTLTYMAGALPSDDNALAWTLSSFVWYQDISYQGETYRGLYFTEYSPNKQASEGACYQQRNGYYIDTVYWFKYEPVKWKIVANANNEATLVCDTLLDIENHSCCSGDPSTAGTWMKETFYNSLFTELEKDLILLTSMDSGAYGYTSSSQINEYIFLLSTEELNSGFSDSIDKQKRTTDYAQSHGACTDDNGFGHWWLRTVYHDTEPIYRYVNSDGDIDYLSGAFWSTYETYLCVCPVLRIKL